MTFTLLAASAACASDKTYAPRTIASIHSLSLNEAEEKHKVVVEGVVTGTPFSAGFSLQDATDGIYIDQRAWHGSVRVGEKVRVWGATNGGAFAPIITGERIDVLGMGPPPVPHRLVAGDLIGGTRDNLYVETVGVVRQAVRTVFGGSETIMLTLDMQPGVVGVSISKGTVDPKTYVDCLIRAVGVGSIEYNRRRQGLGMQVNVNADSDVTILTRPAARPSNAQSISVGEVLRFSRAIDWSHRIRVSGVVTMQRPRQFIVVQDGDQGIRVESRSTSVYEAGSKVEIVAFVGKGEYSPVLETADITRTGRAAPPLPAPKTVAELADGRDDWRLVRTQATLVETIRNKRSAVLILIDKGKEFSAELPVAAAGSLLDLKNGSLLEISGICSILSDPYRQVEGFKMLLRSADDVRVLATPPQALDRNLILSIAGIVALMALLIAAWAMTLRRRVRRQTEWIEAKLSEERAQAAVQSGRSRILELIGGSHDIRCVFDEIGALIASQMPQSANLIALSAGLGGSSWGEVCARGPAGDLVSLRSDLGRAAELAPTRSAIASSASGDLKAVVILSHATESARDLLAISRQCMALALERYELHNRLILQSQFDSLTRLPNRRFFDEWLERQLEDPEVQRRAGAVLLMDLNGFKPINDTLGHAAGDSLLAEIGSRLAGVMGPADMVARVGGDEFMAVLPGIRAEADAERAVERIRNRIAEPFVLGEVTVTPSISIGFALFPGDGEKSSELKHIADQRMYAAKAASREHPESSIQR